ncbi:MAG: glycosyl hydrolase family 18 protein [Fidelibacterota bacterium]
MRQNIFIIHLSICIAFANHNPSIHQQQLEYYNTHYTEIDRQIDTAPFIRFYRTNHTTPSHEVFGYHPYWMGTSWTNYNFNLISTIAYFSAEITATGGISNDHGWPPTSLINTAHAAGTDVVLTATLFSNSDLTTLLSSSSHRQNLINNLVNTVSSGNGDGVNIDFEVMPASQKNNMVQFITDLKNAFNNAIPGSQVTLAMPAVDWSSAWDYNALAEISDGLFIMGYDYHYSGSSTSGPNAPLTGSGYTITWTVNDYLSKTNNQADKLILGCPYFGFEWPTSSGSAGASTTGTGTAKLYSEMESNALSFGKLWHSESQTPWYKYQNPDWFQGWYDDSLSLSLKYDFALNHNLKGVGIWAMGYDGSDPELWDLLFVKFGASSPPATPGNLSIRNVGNGDIMIDFTGARTANEFVVLRTFLNSNNTETLGVFNQRPIIVKNLNEGEPYYLSIIGQNGFGASPQTEFLGVVPTTDAVSCLVVNGFDRTSGTTNTHNFIRQHGDALIQNGLAFDSATNEAVIQNNINLDYHFVDWILGEEGTATSTFTYEEQDLVQTYLENGGFLFVSGSEIGYDLSAQGTSTDKAFYLDYLKAVYISDAAGGHQGTYSGFGTSGSIFEGINNITFDNGSNGTYDVDWPDGIKPAVGADICAKFNGVDYNAEGGMGIQFIGSFGSGNDLGGIVHLSVGFETIYPESKRSEIMAEIVDFYEDQLSVNHFEDTPFPDQVSIKSVFPNPSNSSMTILINNNLPNRRTEIHITDLVGRTIRSTNLLPSPHDHFTWTWNGLNNNGHPVSSGIYIISITSGTNMDFRKVTMVK